MTASRPTIGALVQCTDSDLYTSRHPEDYCIHVARTCGFFDVVVLAVPDVPESAVFDDLAPAWDVRLVKGAVYNVAERILTAADRYEIDIIARLLLRRFYLDTDLVADMIRLLRAEGADYVRLPNDFNYELAADVFTRDALARAVGMLNGTDIATASRQFAPWRLLDEDKANFETIEHPGSPMYPPEKVASIKKKLSCLIAENQVRYGWQFPASAYRYVAQYTKPGSVVLDIACGQGEGARQLAESGFEVFGVDYDKGYIDAASRRFAGMLGLTYICADAMEYSRPQFYDAIVCMHTLEHLSDPLRFLRLCRENLKPDGQLFLEVPLLLPRPLGEPLYPWHNKEYTGEELDELARQAGFRIDKRFGRDRGVYVEARSAREALQYHCSLDE